MHTAAISPRGGVAPKTTRLRGQGLIEYVLIAAVISLAVIFAGPQVSGTIRNQFNQVTSTLDSGTGGASGGSSADADSASFQAAVAKDAKDWTLDEQKAVAEDIAAKGEASLAFAKAKAAMDAGTKFSMKLTNGQTLEYRIIGINHDDLTDGSGKAGLTFLTTSTTISSRMNATDTSVGGWEKSELRQEMNSGEIWNLMASDFQSKVKSVEKITNNVGGGEENKNAAVTATSDKLFLLSFSEIAPSATVSSAHPWLWSEGTQYEAFKGKVLKNGSVNPAIANGCSWWIRSVVPTNSAGFYRVTPAGWPKGYYATHSYCVCPAWCF